MRGPKPTPIQLTVKLKEVLEQISRCYTQPHWLVLRAKIVLQAATGAGNTAIARRLDTTPDTVRKWRARWLVVAPRLTAAEPLAEPELRALVHGALADAPRPGAPDTFTPEQLVQVITVACEDPRASGRESSQWDVVFARRMLLARCQAVGLPCYPFDDFDTVRAILAEPHLLLTAHTVGLASVRSSTMLD